MDYLLIQMLKAIKGAEFVKPELVCEIKYDHFSGARFRHGTKFLRWRPDKDPRTCTFDQVEIRSVLMQRSA